MTDHRFDGADRSAIGMLAEAEFECSGLMPVVLLGARSMSIDVIDLVRAQLRLIQRDCYCCRHLSAVRPEPGHMERIAARPEASDLRVDGRVTFPRLLQFFEHEYRGSFAQHESVARGVER